jgi:hypothetical protein
MTLQSVRQFTNLLDLAEAGVSPGEIKQAVISVLSPYFAKRDMLHDLAIERLVPEAINAQRITADPWAHQMALGVLEIYRNAFRTDQEAALRGVAAYHPEIGRGISEFYTLFHLDRDKTDLPLEEFRYEVFRGIGGLIEACLQPLLRSLLLQTRITRQKESTLEAIRSLSLGNVTGELFDTSGLPDLVAPPPWHVRLNQWRNVAQHHESWVREATVVARIRTGAGSREYILTREDLLKLLSCINMVLRIVRMAHTIIAVENSEDIRPNLPPKDEQRDEVRIFSLASAFASQGFELKDVKVEAEVVSIVLQDVTTREFLSRAAHATQFPYPLWLQFSRDRAVVTVLSADTSKRLRVTAQGSDCALVAAGDIPFDELANRVVLEVLGEERSDHGA